MTRVRLPGLARATKRLADGTKRTYFYAWRGGPMLKAQDGAPLQPGDPEFHAAYSRAHAERKQQPQGTLSALIDLYRRSSEYTGKAPKTRKDYSRYLDMIEAEFGDMPLRATEDPRARGKFKEWRDGFANNPRKADYAWTVLARVLSVAKDRGRISVNVCERGGRIYTADRADKIWLAEDIKALRAVASEPIRMALMLALWTGQREGDLLRLTWTAYDGTRIALRQGKSDSRVAIPVGAPLRKALETTRRYAPQILTNSRGRPWTSDGFRTSWRKSVALAGINGLTFHDLRGTAVTRLALAGCSVPQIAAITGHSPRDAEAILEAHYLGGRLELAEAAIGMLEAMEGKE